MNFLKIFSVVVLCVCGLSAGAQSCIDPFNVNPNYPCTNADYYPVCGCDRKTYRNICEAQYRNGVTTYTDGTCSGFEFDILPNYTNTYLTFTLVQTVNPTFIRMFVIDAFGKVMVQKNITLVNRYFETLDVSWLEQGVYFIMVYDSRDNYRISRFVKHN